MRCWTPAILHARSWGTHGMLICSSSAAPISSTKLRPPRLPPDFVPRPRVHERLTKGWGRPLMLVCAPAGFGKTIALAGWLHEARRPWAWVSWDEHDSDLVSFTSVL